MFGAKVANGLMSGDGAAAKTSPIRSMRELPASNVYSPRTRPPAPASPPMSPTRSPRDRSIRATADDEDEDEPVAVVNGPPSNLDYISTAAMGVMLAVVAVYCNKGAMENVDTELNKMVRGEGGKRAAGNRRRTTSTTDGDSHVYFFRLAPSFFLLPQKNKMKTEFQTRDARCACVLQCVLKYSAAVLVIASVPADW